MWEIREKIAETFSKDGHVFSYDVSIPLEKYYELVDETRNHVGEKAHRVFGFGHLGRCLCKSVLRSYLKMESFHQFI